jgi:adenosine deaminase
MASTAHNPDEKRSQHEETTDRTLPVVENIQLHAIPEEMLREFLDRAPGCELHCHLEGLLKPEQILELAAKHNLPYAEKTLDEIRTEFQASPEDSDLVTFLGIFDRVGSLFTSPEVAKDMAIMAVHTAASQNIRYLDLRYSPNYIGRTHNLDLREVVQAVQEGIQIGMNETGIKVTSTLAVERQMGVEDAWEIERLAEEFRFRGVRALDLANDEANFPPGPYAEVFQAAKACGLSITVHAGEAAGAESVRVAVEDLLADRIGHGVRAYEDPEVERLLIERGIVLEMCPTSNLHLGASESLEMYPLKRYIDLGIKVTVNTDDPGMFGIDLTDEFAQMIQHYELDLIDFRRLTINAVEAAFLNERERELVTADVLLQLYHAEEWLKEQLSLSA